MVMGGFRMAMGICRIAGTEIESYQDLPAITPVLAHVMASLLATSGDVHFIVMLASDSIQAIKS